MRQRKNWWKNIVMKPENLDKYVIGLDYGTLSARAVLVCVGSGEVIAESVYPYPNGIYTNGIYPNRMHPVAFATKLYLDEDLKAFLQTIFCLSVETPYALFLW